MTKAIQFGACVLAIDLSKSKKFNAIYETSFLIFFCPLWLFQLISTIILFYILASDCGTLLLLFFLFRFKQDQAGSGYTTDFSERFSGQQVPCQAGLRDEGQDGQCRVHYPGCRYSEGVDIDGCWRYKKTHPESWNGNFPL